MKRFINTLRKCGGYIGVEVVIVAGLMIGIGAYAIANFYGVAQELTDNAIKKINEVQDIELSYTGDTGE